MASDVATQMTEVSEQLDIFLRSWLDEFQESAIGQKKLRESIAYSLFSGGKRFRPALTVWTSMAYGRDVDRRILAYAAAVEMIHTYSLIHDDLPCMDDDKERRGKPTNHIVFGEDIALLAGDALLTESFALLAKECGIHASTVIRELAMAAGVSGMVGGQAMDLCGQKAEMKADDLESMQRKKTGALIVAAVRGGVILSEQSEGELAKMDEFARALGYAFQVADDILDADDNSSENIVYYIGIEAAKKRLDELSEQALRALRQSQCVSQSLTDIVEFNRSRSH